MEECPICMENLKFNNRKIHTTICNHKFHEMCFKKVKGGTCPCCRAAFPLGITIVISNIKAEIKDLKIIFQRMRKTRKSLISEKKKTITALVKEEKVQNKFLITYLGLTLSNGFLSNGVDFALWESEQKDKIEKIQIDMMKQYDKMVSAQLEFSIMIEYHDELLLIQTNMLKEAQEKKRMGVL